ncbi:nitrate- and nitrite sensing domain-containing protein [Nonomuraea sp. MCN248]|uniref:histidine kinase n=1 Tax=Nonomuraea corallina TaxID=2989783 RepID=A0ABT4S8Z8_9ACTN|nr:nitrate- and nitrite sensing domain-containing protein [Nonomuraea corallina]MDA0633649.1 nitrate- and nitrite sensing domain-containing protein [Nonomuraea corallina]
MPPTRGRPIAIKLLILLLVPLTSLVGLWAFAAALTAGDGIRMLETDKLSTNLAQPSSELTTHLQNERLSSIQYVIAKRNPETLFLQRTLTDKAAAGLRELAGRQTDLTPAMNAQLDLLFRQLDRLSQIRDDVDGPAPSPLDLINGYNQIIDASFRMYDALVLVPDLSLYRNGRALAMMVEAKEMLSRERAMISVVVSRGRVTSAEREAFAEWAATRRLLYSQALSQLDSELRAPYQALISSAMYQEFLEAEDTLREQAVVGALPAQAATWPIDANTMWKAVESRQRAADALYAQRVAPAATGILMKITVAGGVGLVAVLASILLSLRFRKRLVRELAGLRDAATHLARVRLPALVEQLRAGGKPPAGAGVEPLEVKAATAEVHDIVQAFNDVQRTAVDAALSQAGLRHGVNQVFVNLARRNQSLLHRQLMQLDGMERGTEDPVMLEDLFKLDHLTTRMRRHAESLIILSDQQPGRGWRNPVPIVDVLRAAVAEVEEYQRVEVLQPPPISLVGTAVTDVAHLMAELVENATLFSPPRTRVDLRTTSTPHGLTVEVEDRGLGLPREELDQLNERLAKKPEFDLAQSDRLGLFVVGRLAARHGIKVTLAPSPYGGLTARVMLPESLLADQPVLAGR